MVEGLQRSKRPAGLSITHIFVAKGKPECDVGETREAAPHEDVARRRIVSAGKISPEPGDLHDIVRKRFIFRSRPVIGRKTVEELELKRKRNSEYSRRKAGAEKERVEDNAVRSLTVAA